MNSLCSTRRPEKRLHHSRPLALERPSSGCVNGAAVAQRTVFQSGRATPSPWRSSKASTTCRFRMRDRARSVFRFEMPGSPFSRSGWAVVAIGNQSSPSAGRCSRPLTVRSDVPRRASTRWRITSGALLAVRRATATFVIERWPCHARLSIAIIAACCVSLSHAAAARTASATREEGDRPGVVARGPDDRLRAEPVRTQAKGRRDRRLRVHEGDNVTIGFEIRDAGSGNPVSGLNPAAWLGRHARGRRGRAHRPAPIASGRRLSPNLLSRPELDLNTYYVLALNADATITVVDPVFGFGGTKLLAMIPLESPGEDWALTSDQNRLFVSMPAANRVAVVDTRSWSVVASIDIGRSPSRMPAAA